MTAKPASMYPAYTSYPDYSSQYYPAMSTVAGTMPSSDMSSMYAGASQDSDVYGYNYTPDAKYYEGFNYTVTPSVGVPVDSDSKGILFNFFINEK